MSADAALLLAIVAPVGALISVLVRAFLKAHLDRAKVEHDLRLAQMSAEHAAHLRLVHQVGEALERAREDAAASGMMKAVLLERIDRIDRRLGIVESPSAIQTLGEIARASDPEIGGRLPTDRRRALEEREAEQVLERVGPGQYSLPAQRKRNPAGR